MDDPAVLLALGPIAIQAILLVASLIGLALMRRRTPNNQLDDKRGFNLRDNEALADDPVPDVKGYPHWRPPVLANWTEAENLNSLDANDQSKLYILCHLGMGPMDGTGFDLWLDDVKLFDAVTSDSPKVERTLTQVDSDRTRFVIPTESIDVSSIVIYRNGKEVARGTAAGEIQVVDETSDIVFSDEDIAARLFTNRFFDTDQTSGDYIERSQVLDDNVAANEENVYVQRGSFFTARHELVKGVRLGGYLPQQGISSADDLTIEVTPRDRARTRTASMASLTRSSFFVPTQDIGLGKTNAGKDYFYLKGFHGYVGDDSGDSNPPAMTLSGTIKRRLNIEKDASGRVTIVFPESVPIDEEVTGTWRRKVFEEDGFEYQVQWGTDHPDDKIVLPHGSVRSDFRFDQELQKGVPVRVDTRNEVDNVQIGLESGRSGFYSIGVLGGIDPISRKLFIYLKEEDAPDRNQAQGATDLSKGWVQLRAPKQKTSDPYEFVVQGKTGDTAFWKFSAADLYELTKNGVMPASGTSRLPVRARYSVKLVAITAANTNDEGEEVEERKFSELYLGALTEEIREKVEFPRQAMLLLEFGDQDIVTDEPEIKTQFRGRKVVVADNDYILVTLVGDRTEVWQSRVGTRVPYGRTWTRNPIWCTIDAIVDEENGGGQFYDWSNIDMASALEAAAFCDQQVRRLPTLGDFTLETRSLLDIAQKDRLSLFEMVSDYLAGSSVIPVLSGGTWRFVIDEPLGENEDPAYTITDAHTIGGAAGSNKPRITVPSVEDLPTELEIQYFNEELDGETDTELVQLSEEERGDRGIVTEGQELPGVTRRSQVIRWATLALHQLQSQQISVDLVAAGWDLLELRAGDIVQYSSDDLLFDQRQYRVVLSGAGSNLVPVVALVEHDPTVYTRTGVIPSSAVPPGSRPPSNDYSDPSQTSYWQSFDVSIQRVSNSEENV